MSGPVPFRTKDEGKYTNSFPPVVYYRDTYGLEPIHERRFTDSMTTDCSDDSVTTKSTVRTTLNVHNQYGMYESTISKGTNLTQSYHVEQIITNQILVMHPHTLLTLTLIAFASAIQLMIFAMICLFYDGSPYNVAIIVSVLLLVNTFIVFCFLKIKPTRTMLIISTITASLSVIESVALFFWTAYLVNNEDKFARQVASRPNRIITSTRIAMYSLHLIFAPIHALAASLILFVLYQNLRAFSGNDITRGYFLTEPKMGHQKILVPIELRQVRGELKDDDPNTDVDEASLGVQTSGQQSTVHTNWT